MMTIWITILVLVCLLLIYGAFSFAYVWFTKGINDFTTY